MSDFWINAGKVLLLLALLVALCVVAYYLGRSGKVRLNLPTSPVPQAVTTVAPTPEPTWTNEATLTPTETGLPSE